VRRKHSLFLSCAVVSLTGLVLPATLSAGCSSSSPPSSTGVAAASGGSPVGVVRSVPAGYVPLSGSLHPYAKAERDIGRLPPQTAITGASLLLQTSPAQQLRAKAVLADLQDPSSPNFRRWLTPEQVGAWFGASDADLARTTAWLKSRGLDVHGASATRNRLFFSGTAERIESAFQTELHRYDVEGREHFAVASAPLVPDSMASIVAGVHGLHDFHLTPTGFRPPPGRGPRPADIFPIPSDAGTLGRVTLGPSDFATIYGVAPLYSAGLTGAGQTIGIVGESDFNDDDIRQFRTAYGLDATNLPSRTLVPYSGNSFYSPNTIGEAELDLEWSGAVARDASIKFVYTGDNPAYGVWDAIVYSIEHKVAPVVSASFAGCEYGVSPTDMIWAEAMGDAASMMGMTITNSSGDWGATGCDTGATETAAQYGIAVNWPTSVPSIVSVGGTQFNWGGPFPQPLVSTETMNADPLAEYWACAGQEGNVTQCAAKGYVPEMGWNELAYELSYGYWWGAGGGGQSTIFPRPPWQLGTSIPGSNRMVPDISLSAAWAQVGYMMYESWTAADGDASAPFAGEMFPSGGTSAASPSFAGILALVNQAVSLTDPLAPGGLGNANPVLYALAKTSAGTSSPVIHDITTGDNKMPCAPGSPYCPETADGGAPALIGYSAGPGYDMVTGLGSIDAVNLVRAWTELYPTATALRVESSWTSEGSPVRLSATVATIGRRPQLTGSVLFYLETLDGQGLADLSESVTAPIDPRSGTASTVVTVPPGLLGSSRVVASYSGDAGHLASWSAARKVTARSTLSLSPATLTVAPDGGATFTATGGTAPFQWIIVRDSTCNASFVCSSLVSSTATTGTFTAGPDDGQTTVAVIDADGAEARATVTVAGSAATN